jgi:hypothetical protein
MLAPYFGLIDDNMEHFNKEISVKDITYLIQILTNICFEKQSHLLKHHPMKSMK